MAQIIFIIGGSRSGKSSHAVAIAQRHTGNVAFIATAQAGDGEMKRRIAAHKKTRPAGWKTIEEPLELAAAVSAGAKKCPVVIIDCLTLWISNLMGVGLSPCAVEKKTKETLRAMQRSRATVIVIANEVGLGIVPDNRLAREFRDCAGRINQLVAAAADEVFFMAAGIPLCIKGGRSQ